jgi:hypothetical protein
MPFDSFFRSSAVEKWKAVAKLAILQEQTPTGGFPIPKAIK